MLLEAMTLSWQWHLLLEVTLFATLGAGRVLYCLRFFSYKTDLFLWSCEELWRASVGGLRYLRPPQAWPSFLYYTQWSHPGGRTVLAFDSVDWGRLMLQHQNWWCWLFTVGLFCFNYLFILFLASCHFLKAPVRPDSKSSCISASCGCLSSSSYV